MIKAIVAVCAVVFLAGAVATSPYTSDIEDELRHISDEIVSYGEDLWNSLNDLNKDDDEESENDDVKEIRTALDVGDIHITGTVANDVSAYTGLGYSAVTCTLEGDIIWCLKDTEDTYFVKNGDTYTVRGYEKYGSPTITFTEPGRYDLMLYQNGVCVSSGTLTIDGLVHKDFEWTQKINWFRSYSYGISYEYMFSDYLDRADDASAIRRSSTNLSPARFATVSDVVPLEKILRNEYLSVRGSDASVNGQDYADYLLSFVQCCFSYPDQIPKGAYGKYYYDETDGVGEMFLYGQNEYWAYPLETIHHESGDCEDTSFLAAALFKAAGFTSGVLEIPGHMVAFVGLSDFSEPFWLPFIGMTYTEMVLTETQERIYYCETTMDEFYNVGYLNAKNSAEVQKKTSVYLVRD